MPSTRTFLKNYFATVRSVITQPRQFYQDMPTSGGLKEPIGFAALTILMASLLCINVFMLVSIPFIFLDSDLAFFIFLLFPKFIFFVFIMLALISINAILCHIILKIFGAKGSIEATLRVFCYNLAISYVILLAVFIFIMVFILANGISLLHGVLYFISFIIIIAVLLGSVFYGFYMLFEGLSQAHHISMKRVVLAEVFGIPNALFLLIVLMMGFNLVTQQLETFGPSSWYPTDPDLSIPTAQSTIRAVEGPSPVIDGHYVGDNKWLRSQITTFTIEDVLYTITTTHDSENLYILIIWESGPTWNNSIDIRFEQDGDSHDHNLATGRTDYKYNGAVMDGPGNFNDGHFMGGLNEMQNGKVIGTHSDGRWVQEWVVPLKSTDPGDINIENFPATLGFVIFDWGPGVTTGIWPPGADPDEPETWGNLELL